MSATPRPPDGGSRGRCRTLARVDPAHPAPDSPSTDTPSIAAEASRRDREGVEWLFGRLNYERTGAVPYQGRTLKLDRMRRLVARLGSPDAGLKIVHIAGTKGKGSTARMIAGVLTAAGCRTGLYTSPHLERVEERFVVDGVACTAQDLSGLIDAVRPVVERLDQENEPGAPQLTFFDITTAMGLLHFAQRGVGAVVLEVGLGGRLDSTNVCLPVVSVVTSISRDHTRQLGETLPEIATEKAGIIKPGVPVVSGVTTPGPKEVIAQAAHDRGCRLAQLDEHFGATRRPSSDGGWVVDYWRGATRLDGLRLAAFGPHQTPNAAVALAVVDELVSQGWAIDDRARREGLAGARLAARCEVVPGQPTVVLDTAHNEASVEALVAALEELPRAGQRSLVIAVSRDKDLPAIARIVAPRFDRFYATRFLENPRAFSPETLAEALSAAGAGRVQVVETPAEAYGLALAETGPAGLVCVAGSFFLAAELRPLIAPDR